METTQTVDLTAQTLADEIESLLLLAMMPQNISMQQQQGMNLYMCIIYSLICHVTQNKNYFKKHMLIIINK